ncbi:MAG: ABC-2 family transporter protein [Bdellovibrio sp.]
MLKTSFVADLEYRANYITRLMVDMIWYAAQITVFETLYRHTHRIGELNRDQSRVFLGILFVVDALYMIFFSENLDHFSEKVSKGDLDLILSKPVSSQFLASMQKANTAILGNLLFGLCWWTWSLWKIPDLSWIQFFMCLVLILCGVLISYSIRILLASTSIRFTRSENLQYLYWQIYKLGMRPDSIYPQALRWALATVLPMALLASLPTSILLGLAGWRSFLSAIFVSGFFVWFSHQVWQAALKHYSSSSS